MQPNFFASFLLLTFHHSSCVCLLMFGPMTLCSLEWSIVVTLHYQTNIKPNNQNRIQNNTKIDGESQFFVHKVQCAFLGWILFLHNFCCNDLYKICCKIMYFITCLKYNHHGNHDFASIFLIYNNCNTAYGCFLDMEKINMNEAISPSILHRYIFNVICVDAKLRAS